MTAEVWAAVPGWEGLYEVSTEGRVRSLDRIMMVRRHGKRVPQRYVGRVRSLTPNRDGYLRAELSNGDGTRTTVSVHTLVLLAFVGARPDGMEALHRDGDPSNNRPGNLRWGTHAQNVRDAIDHGTHVAHPGSRNGRARLSEADIPVIRERLKSEFPAAIARDYGVNRATIQQIKRGQNWSCVPTNDNAHQPEKAA